MTTVVLECPSAPGRTPLELLLHRRVPLGRNFSVFLNNNVVTAFWFLWASQVVGPKSGSTLRLISVSSNPPSALRSNFSLQRWCNEFEWLCCSGFNISPFQFTRRWRGVLTPWHLICSDDKTGESVSTKVRCSSSLFWPIKQHWPSWKKTLALYKHLALLHCLQNT